jgi:hypothetical protein
MVEWRHCRIRITAPKTLLPRRVVEVYESPDREERVIASALRLVDDARTHRTLRIRPGRRTV